MKLAAFTLSSIGVIASLLTSTVDGHGWLIEPKSRETGSRTDENGSVGCPSNTPGQSTSVQPGGSLKVRYPRNNHIGGFIRWAIVPRGQESKEAFDKNVFHYTCRESGSTCVPPGQNDVFSGDNGADANSILCGDTIPLPNHLKAGDYVLQWTWMSAGSSYGKISWANEQYRSCADLKFTVAGTGTKPSCPSFVGGDRVTKLQGKGNSQCFYFYSNDMVTSVFKGEESKRDEYYKYGKPAQVEKCAGGGGQASTEDEGNAKVKPADDGDNDFTPAKNGTSSTPAQSGNKGQWEFCAVNSECANKCCSKKFSDDGKLKCTPGGC